MKKSDYINIEEVANEERIHPDSAMPENDIGAGDDLGANGGAHQQRAKGNGGRTQDPRHDTLTFCDIAAWAAREPQEREWAVPDCFPLRNVSLLSGEGSGGKSVLLMQLGGAHVLAKDWALALPEPGPFLYFNAEDEEAELERRLAAVAEHYGASLDDLREHYHIVSRFGKDAVLACPDRGGLIQPTPLFAKLKAAASKIKPKMIALDTSADIFAGNEIDRSQVRQFIALLRSLAIAGNSGVIVALHPSLAGISTGTGLSGSTAWHNSVRARAYLTSEQSEDGKDTGLRQLDFKKNNYGPISSSVTLQWTAVGKAGVYIPLSTGSNLEKAAADAKAERIFLELLRRYNTQCAGALRPRGSDAPAGDQGRKAPKGARGRDEPAVRGQKDQGRGLRQAIAPGQQDRRRRGEPVNRHYRVQRPCNAVQRLCVQPACNASTPPSHIEKWTLHAREHRQRGNTDAIDASATCNARATRVHPACHTPPIPPGRCTPPWWRVQAPPEEEKRAPAHPLACHPAEIKANLRSANRKPRAASPR